MEAESADADYDADSSVDAEVVDSKALGQLLTFSPKAAHPSGMSSPSRLQHARGSYYTPEFPISLPARFLRRAGRLCLTIIDEGRGENNSGDDDGGSRQLPARSTRGALTPLGLLGTQQPLQAGITCVAASSARGGCVLSGYGPAGTTPYVMVPLYISVFFFFPFFFLLFFSFPRFFSFPCFSCLHLAALLIWNSRLMRHILF